MKDLIKEIFECTRCRDLNIQRNPQEKYVPNFGDGNPSKPIWIIGLNPKLEPSGVVEDPQAAYDVNKYAEEKLTYFEKKEMSEVHPYFRDFKHIFGERWYEFIREYVFNTDLIKCASKKKSDIPPAAASRCLQHLKNQLETYEPRIVICNGAGVSEAINKIYPEPDLQVNDYATHGWVKKNGRYTYFIFSGFIGRSSNYSKRRIRREFIEIVEKVLPEALEFLEDRPEDEEEQIYEKDERAEELDQKLVAEMRKTKYDAREIMKAIEKDLELMLEESDFHGLKMIQGKGTYRRVTTDELKTHKIWYVIHIHPEAERVAIKIDTEGVGENRKFRQMVHDLFTVDDFKPYEVYRGKNKEGKSHWWFLLDLEGSKENWIEQLRRIIQNEFLDYVAVTFHKLQDLVKSETRDFK